MKLTERIDNYLQNGGLFNPEMMEHEKVRELLLDCRAELARGRARHPYDTEKLMDRSAT